MALAKPRRLGIQGENLQVYINLILRGQKFIKNAIDSPFWRVLANPKLGVKQCYQVFNWRKIGGKCQNCQNSNATDSLGIINGYVKFRQLGRAKIPLRLRKVSSTVFFSYAKYHQQFKYYAKYLQWPC